MSRYVSGGRSLQTYENAIKLLNSRRRQTRPTRPPSPNLLSKAPGYESNDAAPTYRGTPSVDGMRTWLQKIGYSDKDINSLNIIHVAGTKGKGSTCAFTRSLLQQWKKKTGFPSKIGLYTSPDLICVRERIQIDDKPISEDLFTKYFFEVWDRLFIGTADTGPTQGGQPRFLQFMALLAFHVFVREGAEAAIFETHHGGEYDATNFTTKPVVTGISTIGVDHILQLGPTIENIAWHKAGIFKADTPAFSAPQTENIEAVLRRRAAEKGTNVKFVGLDQDLPRTENTIFADVQRTNCSLAIALANAFLKARSPTKFDKLSLEQIQHGVADFSWPGRFETLQDGSIRYFIDGAHNEISIEQAAKWFAKSVNGPSVKGSPQKPPPVVVIFAQLSEERDGAALLQMLANTLSVGGILPDNIIFTTYQERKDGKLRIDRDPEKFATVPPNILQSQCNIWQQLCPHSAVRTEKSIEEALSFAKSLKQDFLALDVLITGSLHLVGGALSLLQSEASKAD